MNKVHWINDREFSIEGVRFLCSYDDYTLQTDPERIVILKEPPTLDVYADVFEGARVRRALEFGIFQGGSPALFSLWFDVQKFVGIDICPPVRAFDEFCRTHPVGRRIRSYYGVAQTDQQRVHEIIATEFDTAPLDLIIDDASHLYRSTRRTFEIAFPYLRPGGTYVIEDWGWAHWPTVRLYEGRTALSMLIMELVMLCASRNDLVSEVRVFPSFAFIRKAPHAPDVKEFNLNALYSKRGIELVGAQHANLGGVGKMLLQNIMHRTTQRLGRWSRRLRSTAP